MSNGIDLALAIVAVVGAVREDVVLIEDLDELFSREEDISEDDAEIVIDRVKATVLFNRDN